MGRSATLVLGLCLVTAIVASPAHAPPRSQQSTSDVPGVAFDRIVQVWLENGNYDEAAADENMRWIAGNGILLSNFYAGKLTPSRVRGHGISVTLTGASVTHPSQPNYWAAVSGDTFGLQDDSPHSLPANISTVVDLLDTRGISWALYQEDMPSTGYQGARAGDYVRKHNPLISFESVTGNATRLARIRTLSAFEDDLANDRLPQWAFVTPNMKNDGHDTGLAYGARWLRGWLGPLLKNERFMNRTLVVVSFDENETYADANRVYTVLLGGAVGDAQRGTTDSMYFNHHSTISSVSANWDLPSLGRWDCSANVFSLVAQHTGYNNTDLSSYDGLWWNESYPGPLNSKHAAAAGWWPLPTTELKCASGKGTLPSVASTWGESRGSYNYSSVYPYDDSFAGTKAGVPAVVANDAGSEPESSAGTPWCDTAMRPLAMGLALVWLFGAA